MFILANFLVAIAKMLDLVLTFYMYVVIAQAILSWVSPDPYNPIVRFINSITEPVLYRIRSRLPVMFGGIDFSPMIVLFGIILLQSLVVDNLFRLAKGLVFP